MDATFDVFVTSKKIVTVWPPFNFASPGGRLIFSNRSNDTIQVEHIAHLVQEPVNPIPPGNDGTYTVKDEAPKGGHSFKVRVKMMALAKGEDVQLYAVTESDDPEIIIT